MTNLGPTSNETPGFLEWLARVASHVALVNSQLFTVVDGHLDTSINQGGYYQFK